MIITTKAVYAVHIIVGILHFVVGLFSVILRAQFSEHFLFNGKLPLTCFKMAKTEDGSKRAFSDLTLDQACATYDLILVCALLHLATAIAHAWYAYLGTSLKWRWAEYTISAPIVFLHTALTSGSRDVGTLILIAVCTSAIMPLGYVMEDSDPPRVPHTDDEILEIEGMQTKRIPYSICIFCGWFVVLSVLFVTLWNFLNIAENGAGDAKVPEFVYGIILSELILLPSFGGAAMLHSRLGNNASNVLHAFLSFSSKILPTVIYLSSIYDSN